MRFDILKRHHRLLIVFAVACGSSPSAAQTPAQLRLDVTRDAWVSAVGEESDGNNGAAPRLKLKSIQEMSLVDVDARPLVGKTIRSAVLHVQKSGAESLLRVTVSSVGAEWYEGTGSGYSIQAGGATFRHRRHPDLPWSTGGGDLCHVILGNGGTLWGMADASAADREGWQRIAVDPRVVAARVAGLSHGFLVFDDTGSEWTRRGETFSLQVFPNRFVYSRDQNRASAPYFTVELGSDDRRPPGAPSAIHVEPETEALPAGQAVVSWQTPADTGPAGTLGYLVSADGRPLPRELIPLAGAGSTGEDDDARRWANTRRNGVACDSRRGRRRQLGPGGDCESGRISAGAATATRIEGAAASRFESRSRLAPAWHD